MSAPRSVSAPPGDHNMCVCVDMQGAGNAARAWQIAQTAHMAAPANSFGGSVGRQSAPAGLHNQTPSPPDPQVAAMRLHLIIRMTVSVDVVHNSPNCIFGKQNSQQLELGGVSSRGLPTCLRFSCDLQEISFCCLLTLCSPIAEQCASRHHRCRFRTVAACTPTSAPCCAHALWAEA